MGLDEDISPAEALTRIDRFVCDIKESQFGEGLHVFGRATQCQTTFDSDSSVAAEQQALGVNAVTDGFWTHRDRIVRLDNRSTAQGD